MKKVIVIGVIALFIGVGFQPVFANNNIAIVIENQQPRGGTFMRTFGGEWNDYGNCVQQTTDGGYIITGDKGGDICLIKTNSNGNLMWLRTFGGPEGDAGYSVRQTTDGGYIITGTKETDFYKCGKIWLIKTDSNGNKEWDRTFVNSDRDTGKCVQQTTDGGYIIVGETFSFSQGWSDVWLIKTDSSGNKEWEKFFGGSSFNHGNFVQQTTDGGYIITGFTRNSNCWLIKTDSAGNLEWDKQFSVTNLNVGHCVQQTTDGGYIITGYYFVFTNPLGYDNLWLIKTDSNGNKEWDKTFGGTENDVGYSVRQTTDGGYIITGYKGRDIWLIKTDSAGNMMWDKTFGIVGLFAYAGARCVQQTTDGGYIITGTKGRFFTENTDIWLIKTDKDGNVRNKAVSSNILLQRLLERFPLFERFLNTIRGIV